MHALHAWNAGAVAAEEWVVQSSVDDGDDGEKKMSCGDAPPPCVRFASRFIEGFPSLFELDAVVELCGKTLVAAMKLRPDYAEFARGTGGYIGRGNSVGDGLGEGEGVGVPFDESAAWSGAGLQQQQQQQQGEEESGATVTELRHALTMAKELFKDVAGRGKLAKSKLKL